MPIYEYHCNDCGHDFEYLVIGGDEPRHCPACRNQGVCRLMSTCGFISKGSGGQTVGKSAGSASCAGCSTASCAGCGH
jgi:putative FmdB family regulatory protein